jgi:hypothetical protein
LRLAKWGSGVSLHGSNPEPPMSLWVKSGHGALNLQCPLYPRKRTFIAVIKMSALCHEQTSALSVEFDKTAGVALLLQIKHQV